MGAPPGRPGAFPPAGGPLPTRWLERLAQRATDSVSSPWGTLAALGALAVWLAAVPLPGWSRAWGLVEKVIFASSFRLLFLLQRGQTEATLAMQVKLNELPAAEHRASHQLINVENKSEEEVRELHDRFQVLQERGPGSHSIAEAAEDGPGSPRDPIDHRAASGRDLTPGRRG